MTNYFKKFPKLIFYSFLCSIVVYIPQALASVDTPRGTLRTGTGYDSSITRFSDMNTFLTSAVDFALNFVAILAIAAIIYGGFLMLTSQGDEEKHQKGIKVVIYSVIGIVLILASYAIVNTVISFGTGTEGVTGTGDGESGNEGDQDCVDDWWNPFDSCDTGSNSSGNGGGGSNSSNGTAGDTDEGSDNSELIGASLQTTTTSGTLPLSIDFNVDGSYDNSSNTTNRTSPAPNDFYWQMGDKTAHMGILVEVEGELMFKPGGNEATMPIISTMDSARCIKITGCETSPKYVENINQASEFYENVANGVPAGSMPADVLAKFQAGVQTVERILESGAYPVLIYGRKKQTVAADTYETLTGENEIPTNTEVIEVLDPGAEGQIVTILNPYGLKLGYIQSHTYREAQNFRPKVMLVNDGNTPFSPTDDLKAYKSILIQASKTNIDLSSTPPTSAYIYEYDPDDPKRVFFRNMSLTADGNDIAELLNGIGGGSTVYPLDSDEFTDSDGDGNPANDNDTFYFEWDFDLDKDTSGDGNPTNDNDYSYSGINEFNVAIINPDTSAQVNFTDTVTVGSPAYTIRVREAGLFNYKEESINSGESIVIPNVDADILYFQLKTSDGRFSPEIKVNMEQARENDEGVVFHGLINEEIFKLYEKDRESVRVKLMVKNLITQDQDSVIRQLQLLDKAIIAPTLLDSTS